MVAYIKYLKAGGETTITNCWDEKILNNGVVISPFGQHEMKSFTCNHCNRVTFVDSGVDPTDTIAWKCTCCSKLVCKNCASKPCVPLQDKLDFYERGWIKDLF